jgi:pimeloyl-ACP methyl ester carboxylesterase
MTRRPAPRLHDPLHPEDSFVEVNGVRLHYLDYGGEGDVLLFVPGSTMTAQSYNAVAPHFTDRYRVLAVTRRWHGASEKTDLTFDLDTLAADLGAFLDHFTDRPAIVAGWSYAGLELTRLARARPDLVRALVFLDANYDPSAFVDMTPPPAPRIDSVFPSLAAAVDVFRELLPRVDSALVLPLRRAGCRLRDRSRRDGSRPPHGRREPEPLVPTVERTFRFDSSVDVVFEPFDGRPAAFTVNAGRVRGIRFLRVEDAPVPGR